MSYVLGTDIGTGSIKAVAIALDGRPIDSLQEDYPLTPSTPGRSEQDPLLLFDTWMNVVRTLIEKLGRPPECISFSSAMHGLMAVDENGEPITPLITWSDLRAADEAAALRALPAGEDIYNHTGTPIHAMSPLCKLAWLRRNKPEIFRRAHRFIAIKEFIWHRLFGEFAIDHSIASATGLFDSEKKDWYASALGYAGITPDKLSRPVPTTYLKKECTPALADKLRITGTVSFCIGASDGCLASLGTDALDPGTAAVTIGTSGAVRVALDRPLRRWPAMPFSYVLDEKIFICGGPVNNGGNIVHWLLRQFCNGETDYDRLFAEAEGVAPGAEGLVFLPYLHGERAPVWDEQSCGVYFGIGPQHGRAHFIRAALEGICFGLRQVLGLLEEKGAKVEELCVSGGFVRSPFWLQLLSDSTQKSLRITATADASATGAALLALGALGYKINKGEDEGTRIRPQAVGAYDKNFALYSRLYPALKEVMHER